jgi:Sortase domain
VSGRQRLGAAGTVAMAMAPVMFLVACGTTGPALPAAPAHMQVAASAAVPAPTVPTAVSATARKQPAPATPLAPDDPVVLAVPAIGLRTGPLLRLGLDARGALEVPTDATRAGWFTLGPTPGATGPAVITGPAGDRGVPGVFHRLQDLAPGDEISVTRADGSTAVFGTYRVERHPESEFPSDRVYGDTAGPELRLVTRSSGHRENVVAYARLVRVP